jgi:hypothetical protein
MRAGSLTLRRLTPPPGGEPVIFAAKVRVGERAILTTKDLARQRRNQSSKPYFTTEAQSSQSSEFFLIKNSLLRALRASAVSSY